MKGTIRYQRELQTTYLIVSGDRELAESYAGCMALSGNVKGLVTCKKHLIDGEWEIWYDISSMQPLEQVYAVKEIGYAELKSLLGQVLAVLEEMERCLLDGSQLCFHPKYLYFDMEKEQVRFLFDYTEKRETALISELAEYLLERTSHEDEKAVELVYFFYSEIQKENFSIRTVEDYLAAEPSSQEMPERKLSKCEMPLLPECEIPLLPEREMSLLPELEGGWMPSEKEEAPAKRKRPKLGKKGAVGVGVIFLSGIGLLIVQHYFSLTGAEILLWLAGSVLMTVAGVLLAVVSTGKREKTDRKGQNAGSRMTKVKTLDDAAVSSEGVTAQFEEGEFYRRLIEDKREEDVDGRTVYVGNALLNREYRLVEVRKGEEKEYRISAYPFLIGKEKGRVNLEIKDRSVSRIHARLTEEDGMIYVEDLHSTNGTYLNDLLLEPHERMRLKKGDILQFGRVEFDFR